jgi:hypothetical protein
MATSPKSKKKKTHAASPVARSAKRASPKSLTKTTKSSAGPQKKKAEESMLALHTSDKKAEFKKHEHDQIFQILQKQNAVYRKKLADQKFKDIADKRTTSHSVVQLESLKDALEESYSKFVKKWHASRKDFSKTFAHSIDMLLSLTIRKQGLDRFPAYVPRPSVATTQRRTSLSSSGELKVFDDDDSYGSPHNSRDNSPEPDEKHSDSPRSRSSSLGSLAGSASSGSHDRNPFHQRLVADARSKENIGDAKSDKKSMLRNLGTHKEFLAEVKSKLEIYKRHLDKSNKASKDDYLLSDKKNAVEVLIRRAEENDYEGFNKEWEHASETIKKHRPKSAVGFKMKFTAAFPYEGKKLIQDIEKMNANLAKPAHYGDSRNQKKRGEFSPRPSDTKAAFNEDYDNENTSNSRKKRRTG